MSDLPGPVEYRFSFSKKSNYKGESLFNLDSNGGFLFEKDEVNAEEPSFKFTNLKYQSSNRNDPLLFSPIN